MEYHKRLGGHALANGVCEFLLWAPFAKEVKVLSEDSCETAIPMQSLDRGYFHCTSDDLDTGTRYWYLLDNSNRCPDPASRFQPEGVFGPSEVTAPTYSWTDDAWGGLELSDYIIYELHVGTFTKKGDFNSIVSQLDYLKDLGVTAIELMPIAQFSGNRNWGYDGTYPYAVQSSYGRPEDLKALVDACHARGLAVILDVVYNHLGPEGNFVSNFGPYFINRYKTPWGEALNFDGPGSDEVRRYFIENALYWITDFHFDALRLDAVHAILDLSPKHFLEELVERVDERAHTLNRKVHLIAENDTNSARLIRSQDKGGYGLSGQWSDDLHHSLHSRLAQEQTGYYQDFGNIAQVGKALQLGYAFTGEYSEYRGRRHGSDCHDVPTERFVVCKQNHDQVGNRMLGERLFNLVSFEATKLATSTILFSPYIPLLFMGEEYGETAPFLYFVDHSDKKLLKAIRDGRKEEFSAFSWKGEPSDPAAHSTFNQCIIDPQQRKEGKHAQIFHYYKVAIELRKRLKNAGAFVRGSFEVTHDEARQLIRVLFDGNSMTWLAMFHFGTEQRIGIDGLPSGNWSPILDSSDQNWGGPRTKPLGLLRFDMLSQLIVLPESFLLLASEGD